MKSRLRYGIIFWGNSSSASRIFVLQKRAIRCMFGLNYRESCKSTFINQNILTLSCLYIFEILKFVKNNLSTFNSPNVNHDYPTRHGYNLQYNIHRLEIYKNSPYYMGCTFYNKLSIDIKSINNTKNFFQD